MGRLLNVSNVTVLYWVRKAAKALRQTQTFERSHEPVKYIQMDEIWHYLKKTALGVDCL